MLDLDRFKTVNDELGHAAGDRALAKAGEVIQNSLRARDRSMCARIGGDEFAVLLPETSLDEAMQAAERIRSRTADAMAKVHPECGASVGVAWAEAGASPANMMASADRALYRAKLERGRVSS